MAWGRGRPSHLSWIAATAIALAVLLLPLAGGAPPTRAPAEGATAEYALSASGGAPDGSFRQVTEARLVLRLADGVWTGTCTGTTTTTSYDGTSDTVTFAADSPLEPPQVPRGLHRGEQVDPALTSAAAEGCRHDLGPLVVAGKDGRILRATEPSDASAYQDATLNWDARSGLVVAWSFAGRGGGFEGRLVSSSGL